MNQKNDIKEHNSAPAPKSNRTVDIIALILCLAAAF